MHDVFDDQGNKLVTMPLSEKQLKLLEAGAEITVQYHTPQLLLHLLGQQSGQFKLRKHGGKFISEHPDIVRHFAILQKGIKAARD
jgi:hypothetical protein